jgi:hypothetical protein
VSAKPDPLLEVLETFAAGGDLAARIEEETHGVFDRIAAHLDALEWQYVASPAARQRAAVARLATEQASRG